jgi:hypothetical protein
MARLTPPSEREESLEELLERQLLVEEGALDENEEDFDG